MNITELIKSHKELNELPFRIVFRTIVGLQEKGLLKDEKNVDRVQH